MSPQIPIRILALLFVLAPSVVAALAHTLTAKVEYVPKTQLYRYEYLLTNLAPGERELRRFSLFLDTESGARAVRQPDGWAAEYYPLPDDFGLVTWRVRDDAAASPTAAFVVESPAPPGVTRYGIEHVNPRDERDGEPAAEGEVIAPTGTPVPAVPYRSCECRRTPNHE